MKRETQKNLSDLHEQKKKIEGTEENLKTQLKSSLSLKRQTELEKQAESDLESEKELLTELTRQNRPFLSAGKTTAKTSKHIACTTRKRTQKPRKHEIQSEIESSQMRIKLLQAIVAKSRQKLVISALSVNRKYSAIREGHVNRVCERSAKPLLVFLLAAWRLYVKVNRETNYSW